MTDMTSTTGAWARAEHPRDLSGRFDEKEHTAPEAFLITGVPEHLRARQAVIAGVPWHLRTDLTPTSAADNPLLVEYLSAQVDHGDTAERWAEAINAYFDGDENPRNDDDVFTIVHQVIGAPNSYGDVDHWHARTAAWRDHALAALAADDTV